MQAMYAASMPDTTPSEVFSQLLVDDYQALHKKFVEAPDRDNDAEYLKNLFYGALQHQAAYEQLLTERVANWDIRRIATIDKILLLLGIHEMLHCPEIPVKVSINEYIDIAKAYSTEKSSQFVNGILDAIYNELNREEKIQKFGKGLLESGQPNRAPNE